MTPCDPTAPPSSELRILIGGSIDECIGEIIAKVVENHLGYLRVTARTIEALLTFLEAATEFPSDELHKPPPTDRFGSLSSACAL